jgi:flagellar hook-associated protein 1 FlgK
MGLFGILSIADQSLAAQQTALTVTSNNIANVNTPGYSRRVAQLAEQAPFSTQAGGGGGVQVANVTAVRDAVLEIRVQQETQTQSKLTSLQQQLGPVEALFSEQGGAGLGTAIDNFFSALQQLSTDPSSGAQRQAAITAAQTMTQTFQQVSRGISQQISGADQEVVQQVGQVNNLTTQIAQLNGQIADLQNARQDTASLVDQRTNLMGQLSGLMDFNVSSASNGQLTLTTSQGQALVVGTDAHTLTLAPNGAGTHDIYDDGTDITATISGGALAGMITARDQNLPGMNTQLDQLAASLSNSVNTQNAAGFDASGNPGGNLFTVPGATGAAATMSLSTTDPNAIAASGTGSPGDNTNLLTMLGLQNQPIAGGLKPDDAYAAMISHIGSLLQGANTQQQASQTVLSQLQNQRASYSGVSMDEESVHLTQFQQAYQAAARVVGVVNTLTDLAINLGKD